MSSILIRKTIVESKIKDSLPAWNEREKVLLLELAAYALISEHRGSGHSVPVLVGTESMRILKSV